MALRRVVIRCVKSRKLRVNERYTPQIKRVKGAYTPVTPTTTLHCIPNTYYQVPDPYYIPQAPGDYMPPMLVMHVPAPPPPAPQTKTRSFIDQELILLRGCIVILGIEAVGLCVIEDIRDDEQL
ncbi:hypothetical protein DFH08DRAFT_828351 [Mycena albidolilacea]|uniref:Uncharacterized protein n=1 Tax=Mycena albidolilacea TaxID=1033008 RepID=A0AAD6YWK7_9AGAR|nr:hypothetical protein DFH08DRAFT_828351 [Mycena albidolilacea]